jgi:hypothetical protein
VIKYLGWLNERKDLEAINKLSPIVGRMTDLFVAITEGLSRDCLMALMSSIGFVTKLLTGLLRPARQRRLSNSLRRSISW